MILRGRYQTVGEVAQLFGVREWTLRRLERLERIPPARRDPISGYRVYDPEAITRIGEAFQEIEREMEMSLPA